MIVAFYSPMLREPIAWWVSSTFMTKKGQDSFELFAFKLINRVRERLVATAPRTDPYFEDYLIRLLR